MVRLTGSYSLEKLKRPEQMEPKRATLTVRGHKGNVNSSSESKNTRNWEIQIMKETETKKRRQMLNKITKQTD